jgi:dipeptidyl-peptidase 4
VEDVQAMPCQPERPSHAHAISAGIRNFLLSAAVAATIAVPAFAAALSPAAGDLAPSPYRHDVSERSLERAESLLSPETLRRAKGVLVTPHWISDTRFWYEDDPKFGRFALFDATTKTSTALFDDVKLLAALRAAAGTTRDQIASLDDATLTGYAADGRTATFDAGAQHFRCDLGETTCRSEPAHPALPDVESVSPNGRWHLRLDGGNLVVADGEKTTPLTRDGTTYDAYAWITGNNGGSVYAAIHNIHAPRGRWSPDSRYFLTHQTDERKLGLNYVLQLVPPNDASRPILRPYPLSLPGESNVPMVSLVVFDPAARRAVCRLPPIATGYDSPVNEGRVWWAPDGEAFYFIDYSRDLKSARLMRVALHGCKPVEIIKEVSDTPVWFGNALSTRGYNIRFINGGRDVLWFSSRTGWGHYYLYDAVSGKLKNAVTSGAYSAYDIVAIDTRRQTLFFTAAGREPGVNPYFRILYAFSSTEAGSSA